MIGVESQILLQDFSVWELSLGRLPLYPSPRSPLLPNLGDEPGLPFLEKYPTPSPSLGPAHRSVCCSVLSLLQLFSGKTWLGQRLPRKHA